ncbi:hypothetical protein HH212_19175 [Massilia forsythiae]|uniref:Gylcosyl hydrolase 115 C-terminal domain-containing protein n=1 Tax=Massilia forsythiae TaxID=2728020 RepID=A0A7Z2VZ33_9BURK|nr:glycosyl hydrolase 115 family protein [Massilia forsythiae]QJE01879.1 hypothetical protein HH212_19175 [Massilia forsythiae]
MPRRLLFPGPLLAGWLFLVLLAASLLAGAAARAAAASPAAALPAGYATSWIRATGAAADFPLATGAGAAALLSDPADAAVVGHALRDLAADVERVSGRRPDLRAWHVAPASGVATPGPVVLVGTLGKSALADALAAGGKIDLSGLRGTWESFVIATVERPLPGVERALAIVGSDPRGTAFGVYELAQAIGVSPWHWWADVAPPRRDALYVAAGLRRFGPPSVKYRGVFLNDEDWGLQPWAARTFEPEHGGIGPRTHARLFELLLRLKANTLWPAMHPGTPAFNADPENARLADEWGIVMGSSHAEPMLRNNVGEWTAPAAAYDYQANRDGVRAYWEQRVAANGRYENLYTVGMRGIHDSAMQGPKDTAQRAALLERIFDDQRALLAKHVDPQVARVPQLFVPYKEVLAQYRQGLRVPDDVTVMWTDDNFGYVRNFTAPAERGRAGGFGVYYHLSYLGAPLSYLWLATTPPALVWEELRRSYDAGADRVWIVNVGDLKPAEIGTEFFLQLAWDIDRWRADNLGDYLRHWAAREFGAAQADAIAAIMADWYRLNFRRRPEHLQWWLPKQTPRAAAWDAGEADARLLAFARLRERVEALQPAIPAANRDAWFELVAYPVQAAALANQRFIEGERFMRGERDSQAAALAADLRLQRLTAYWDGDLAGGKWRHFMREEPADGQWPSFRLRPWRLPAYADTPPAAPAAAQSAAARPAPAQLAAPMSIEAERFDQRRAAGAAAWQAVTGLGTSGEGGVTLVAAPPRYPASATGTAFAPGAAAASGAPADVATPQQVARDAARLDYRVTLARAGKVTLRVQLLPTHPSTGALRFALALDDGTPRVVELPNRDGDAVWAQGVLDNRRLVPVDLGVTSAGAHTLRLYGIDAGVVVDRMLVDVVEDGTVSQ